MKKAILIPLIVGLLLTAGSVLLATAASGPSDRPTVDPTFAGYGTELVSQQWGAFGAVQVSGTFAYVPQGQRLSVFDIADPDDIKMVGQSDMMTGPSDALEISGGYAFLADPGVKSLKLGSRLHILDISNPEAPFEAVYLENLNSKAYDIEIFSGYAFLANHAKGLWVVDVRDPLHPQHVTNRSVPEGAVDNLEIAHHTASNKTYAYLLAHDDFVVVDITDPSVPVWRASLKNDSGYGFHDLVLHNDRAYLTDATGVLHVIDISDPLHPVEVSATIPGEHAYEGNLSTDNNFLYTVDWSQGLRVLDISGGGLPVELGLYTNILSADDIFVPKDTAKVFLITESNLEVINASSPSNPQWEGSFHQQGSTGNILRSGNRLYMNQSEADPTSVEVYDFSNLQNPILLGSLPVRGGIDSLSDDYLYLIKLYDYSVDPPVPGGLVVVDAHDPANMSIADEISVTEERLYDVAVHGGLAFLAEGGHGLRILDISDPSNLIELNRYVDAVDSVRAISVGVPANQPDKTYAYIKSSSTLSVLDVTDPMSITKVSSLSGFGGSLMTLYTPPAGSAAAPDAGYYVAVAGGESGVGGVDLFDVSNPAAPVYINGYSVGEEVEGLIAQNGVIAASAGLKGVYVLTFDGSNFDFLGNYRLPEEVFDAVMSGDFLQLSAGSNGLFNIWLGPPSYLYMPVTGGVLTSTFHNTSLVFPSGSFTETIDMNYHPRYQGNMPTQPGLHGVGIYIDLHPWGSSNTPLTPTIPYQFAWRYDDADLAGLDESALGLYYLDGSSWRREPTSQVDTINNILTAESQRIHILAVLAFDGQKLFLPAISR